MERPMPRMITDAIASPTSFISSTQGNSFSCPYFVTPNDRSSHIQLRPDAPPEDGGRKLSTPSVACSSQRDTARLRSTLCASDSLGSESSEIAHKISEDMRRQNLDGHFLTLDRDNLIREMELLLDLVKHGGKFLVRTDQPSIIKILCRVRESNSPVFPAIPKIRVQRRNKTLNFTRVSALPRLLIELDWELGNVLDVEGLPRDLRGIEQW